MNNFKDGDLVVVRSDLTMEEKNMFPHFVMQMESCCGHIYRVREKYGFDIERCEADSWAPDPSSYSWIAQWFATAFIEDEEGSDMSALWELV